MLFKYVVSATPSTEFVMLQDIALLLSGETVVTNLSAHCDKTESGFVTGTAPIASAFTTENDDGTEIILKRAHSEEAGITLWLGLRSDFADGLKMFVMDDGTAGVVSIPSSVRTSVTNTDHFRCEATQASSVIYVWENAGGCGLTGPLFGGSYIWAEIRNAGSTDSFLHTDNLGSVGTNALLHHKTFIYFAKHIKAVGTSAGDSANSAFTSAERVLDGTSPDSIASFTGANDAPATLDGLNAIIPIREMLVGNSNFLNEAFPLAYGKLGAIYHVRYNDYGARAGSLHTGSSGTKFLTIQTFDSDATLRPALTTSPGNFHPNFMIEV